ncbi:MAG: 30S ribosome-binding factor RbfA [Holosporaceae bacterium]|jgi:ribosome-binding factor A|nr:30S ribosome-binding factor RbfA [Holosporaceae bacterium]
MQKKNSDRPNRVAVEIKKMLSAFLLGNPFVDEKINSSLISITDVMVSPCLHHAKVYIVSLSKNFSNNDCLEFLKKHTPSLRHQVGTEIRLKFVPELLFFSDNSFDDIKRIESLLRDTKTPDASPSEF